MDKPDLGVSPVYLTAAETLALIAHGDVRALDRRAPGPATEFRPASDRIGRAVLSGQIHPLGRPGNMAARSFASLNHEPVPAPFFAHGHRIVTRDGWATLDADACSGDDFLAWRSTDAPDWGDLRFPADEAMALWRPRPAPPPPKLQDLPAAWTLLQCLVWISLRDTAAVRDAGPTGTPGPGYGDNLWCSMTVSCEWVFRKTETDYQLGPSPGEGEAALVAKLQSGALVAQGTPADGSGRRAMTPADWAGLRLYGARHSGWAGPARTMGQVWEDVILSRDDVVQEWRPFAEPNAGGARSTTPGSDPTPLSAPPAPLLDTLPADWTLMEAVAWIALRDPVVVQRAGSIPAEGAIASQVSAGHDEGRRRPDGLVVHADWPAGHGIPLAWIDLEHGKRTGGGEVGTMPADAAVAALMEMLRSGGLTARGEWANTGERRDIPRDEWRSLTLDTAPSEARILVPHRISPDRAPWPDARWRRVTITRASLVTAWPIPMSIAKREPLDRAMQAARAIKGKYVDRVPLIRKQASVTKRIAEEAAKATGEGKGRGNRSRR